MINVFETDIAGGNSNFLNSMSYVTLILSLIPLAIFIWLAVRSKNIRAFQFQISVFIAVYIIGEIIENIKIAAFSILPQDIGSQIHVGSAIFFTIMVWLRFFYAEKSGKKMIENNSESNSSTNSNNN
jgi:glucan phosphoethanolaminetransferase (alkaline phosphatase superfamily)